MRSSEVKPLVIALRRLLASVVITPAVAGAYVLGYGMLVALGAGQSETLLGIVGNGIMLGVVASLWFSLSAFSKK